MITELVGTIAIVAASQPSHGMRALARIVIIVTALVVIRWVVKYEWPWIRDALFRKGTK